MYLPEHFEQTDVSAIGGLITDYPLGTLVTWSECGIVADHIPFLMQSNSGSTGSLIGHVARNNELWHRHDMSREVLVIFQGSTAYISPNWYPTKQDTHEVVPTYNYLVAHVYGMLVVHDDEKWVRGIVGRLTKTFEANQPIPWKMADAPREYIDDQLTQIVGIEIPITRIMGKWKASQNRPIADQIRVAEELSSRDHKDDQSMSDVIRTRLESDSRQ